MTAGTAEAFIKIEMAERGIEVVAPHQADHAPSEPDAFRVSRGAVDRLRRFHELVGLALAIFGRIRRGLLGSCVLGPEVTALSDGGPYPDKQSKCRNGDSLKNGNSKPGTNQTHEIPDEWRASRQRSAPDRCPAIAAEDCLYRNYLIPMKDIYVFVQQGGSLMWSGIGVRREDRGQEPVGSWQTGGDRLSTCLPGGRNPFPFARHWPFWSYP